ncbi:unnamed protein product [Trichogramma brassicae]|uniref:Retrotransposon gag domain-containing protein n=1 Tax=Trichogramma brassicae TaxID=86971 RepID=A0A6H5IRK8_9HYME|nr:unnamed protein product [Trichogramma brassicae]
MPVEHSPVRTRSQSRQRQVIPPPLLEVANNPVAPNGPRENEEIPPPPQGNYINGEPAHVEPLLIGPQNDQHLAAVPPEANQVQPLGNNPAIPQNIDAMANPVVPPALVNWEAFARALVAHQPSLPEYHGLDYEDPNQYLTKCEEYCTALQIPEGQRVAALQKGLKDAADKWWQCYKPMGLTYARFAELLRARFDSQSTKSSLVAKLYGTAQGEKENVGTFLQRKYMLYLRLRPNEDEATKVSTLRELLRPSIRKSLRAHTLANFAELLTHAQEIENDENDERQQPKAKNKESETKEPPKGEKRLPRCWYCPERHLNKDCPDRPQNNAPENWRREGTHPAHPSQDQNDRS